MWTFFKKNAKHNLVFCFWDTHTQTVSVFISNPSGYRLIRNIIRFRQHISTQQLNRSISSLTKWWMEKLTVMVGFFYEVVEMVIWKKRRLVHLVRSNKKDHLRRSNPRFDSFDLAPRVFAISCFSLPFVAVARA